MRGLNQTSASAVLLLNDYFFDDGDHFKKYPSKNPIPKPITKLTKANAVKEN